jgi:putative NIF3 family GTP cyclohydrolase 1 type 2
MAESIGYPTIVSIHTLTSMCHILTITGKPLSAIKHATEAHRDAEHMGDIYLQAWSLYLQARCHAILANYQQDQFLLQQSRDLLTACGLQQSA